MKKDYWLDCWKKNETAFHLETVNPLLEKYWPQLNIEKRSAVFVPLCGKSLDLLWLANQGYSVFGVEISETACEAFFKENKLDYQVEKVGSFNCYFNQNIKIFCGDFFVLSLNYLPNIVAVYDRAALIALPPELRQRYSQHLTELMTHESKMLLITLYSEDIVRSPPFPVSAKEVNQLYAESFEIEKLSETSITEISPHLQEKGFHLIVETIYKLIKRL